MNDPIEDLKNSFLFTGALPVVARLTRAEWLSLTDEERESRERLEDSFRKNFRNRQSFDQCIEKIGEEKLAAAVPNLQEICSRAAVQWFIEPVVLALLKINSESSRAAVESYIDDSNRYVCEHAVNAFFMNDLDYAYDGLSRYFSDERIETAECEYILSNIFKRLYNAKDMSHFGFLTMAVKLRNDTERGFDACRFLQRQDQEAVKVALKNVLANEGPVIPLVQSDYEGDLFSQYMAGHHVAVWHELRSFEKIEGDLLIKVTRVVDETMRRVAKNVDLLASRLKAKGWRTEFAPVEKPVKDLDSFVSEIETVSGFEVPLSLRKFWQHVGGVYLLYDIYNQDEGSTLAKQGEVVKRKFGFDLDLRAMDPLVVAGVDKAADLGYWSKFMLRHHPEIRGKFPLAVSPNAYQKVDDLGDEDYYIYLPFYGVDPPVTHSPGALPFVEYLRKSLKWGGFPLLEEHALREDVQQFVKEMTEGFVEF